MYENAGLDVNTIYAKSQLLLCSYRRICWSVQMMRTILWMNPVTMVRIILLH